MASKKILVDIMVVDKNATRTINKTTNAIDQMAKATTRSAAANNRNKTNAGLNNAIIAESARLASDASFGFTAIANNLGQLVSLFDASRRAAGGLTAAISALFTKQALFLIAIQLVITYGKQIFELFQSFLGFNKIISETFKDAAKTVSTLNGNFTLYIKTLQDSTKSEEQHKIALEKLNKEFPDYISSLKEADVTIDDVKNKTKEATLVNDQYTESIKRVALSRAASNKIEEEQSKALQLELDVQAELLEDFDLTLEQARQRVVERERDKQASIEKKNRDDNNTAIKSRIKRLVESIDEENKLRQANIDSLMKYVMLEDKANKSAASLRKDFVAGQLNFTKEIIQSENRILLLSIKNKDKQIEIEGERIRELAILRQSEFALREQDKVNAIKNIEDKAKAQIIANKAIAESKESLDSFLLQIDRETDAKINQRRLDNQADTLSLFMKGVNELLVMNEQFGVATAQNDFDRITRQRRLEEQKNKAVIAGLRQEKLEAIEKGNSTLAIDQKIFNENEKFRQQNALLDKAESEAKLSLANYVGDAIIQIAGEGSAVGKTVAVAMATMNTYEAITAALGAKPYTPFNIAQAAATGAFGFLQVKKILQTKTPAGGGGSAPSGVGGTGDVVAPDFNVVGATGTSTLARVLGEGSRRPTRAYVSMNDVIENNEIIRNIEDTVSL